MVKKKSRGSMAKRAKTSKPRASLKAKPKKTGAKKAKPKKAATKGKSIAKPKTKVKAVVPARSATNGASKPMPNPLPNPGRARRVRLPRRNLTQGAPRAVKAPAANLAGKLPGGLYESGLGRNQANYQALTPLSFLERAAQVHAPVTAIVHGRRRITYAQFFQHCRQLASALAELGIGKNDTVSVLLPNVPAMLEAHHGVAMTGAVLNALNTRLDPAAIAFILDHAETKILIVDREFATTATAALKLAKTKPYLIQHDDKEFPQTGVLAGAIDYEVFLAAGDPEFSWSRPGDEWDAISLNYTSGTTGNPKGVVCHHRGAALMGYANILACEMRTHPIYLWTLPMFHCNGWCFPWTLALNGGTHVCLRWVRAKEIYDLIADEKVTHLCGSPIVMGMLLNAKPEERRQFTHRVNFVHAAAPPPEAVLMAMPGAGFSPTHVYGLTETYGPATVNEWKTDWDALPSEDLGAKRVRQGVAYPALESLTVLDPKTLEQVPADGKTLGEVMFRGNIVMKGYLKNPKATEDAFAGGWFHSGDLGVLHPDGYIQLKDRSKDIIISGGENISSIEVEDVLHKHPAVLFAAVVAKPDEKWGETACAFVETRPDADPVGAADLIAFCRDRIAHYKCPKTVVFCKLPKTTTGKIQKFKLRERAKDLA